MNKDTVGIGINDMPIWLYKEFKEECKRFHNDVHWVTFMVWHDKARAYDKMLAGQIDEQVEEVQETNTNEVKTIGGVASGRSE